MAIRLKFKPIEFKNNAVIIIDQLSLPEKLKYIEIKDYKRLGEAIKKLELRGAPLIGVAVAYGLVLSIINFNSNNFDKFYAQFKEAKEYLQSTRPTAVNLFHTLKRMETILLENNEKSVPTLKKILKNEAEKIYKEDLEASEKIGSYGSKLIKNNDIVLTHCNAGGLATTGLGTALSVLFTAKAHNKKFKVFVDETRPLLQGARLTTWALLQYKIDTTLICDNMAAYTIKKKKVTKIIVGADRIAKNGDAANKIGTYNLAILAKYQKIPFYIAAPRTTFDFEIKNSDFIPIEERDPEEITKFHGYPIAPVGIKTFNPAFDVIPNNLISGFITDVGVLLPPYSKSFKKLT